MKSWTAYDMVHRHVSCEYGNELSDFKKKGEEFRGQLNDY
jgi:hypothetical protein